MWLNVALLASHDYNQECWLSNIRTVYNMTDGSYSNAEGVRIKASELGKLSGLGPHPAYLYFQTLIGTLQDAGYRDEVDLFGAAYDFRLLADAHSLKTMYNELQSLAERAYRQDGRRVVIVGHGLGALYFLRFLNTHVEQTWKDRHIEAFVTVSAPFGGSAKAISSVMSGSISGIPDTSALNRVFDSMGAFLWYFPNENCFPHSRKFARYKNTLYSAKAEDLVTLLEHMNLTQTAHAFSRLFINFSDSLKFPSVDVYSIYGSGVRTETFYRLSMSGKIVNIGYDGSVEEAEREDGNLGDGVVELASLQFAKRLFRIRDTEYLFSSKQLRGRLSEHNMILSNPSFLDYLVSILGDEPKRTRRVK